LEITMAAINPPGWLQNAGATHTAEQMRNWEGLLIAGASSANSLVTRGGVNGSLGFQLQTTQTGSPSMAVIVRSGACLIPGTEGFRQGVYAAMNDGDLTVSIAAAHATLPRIDSIIFKVEDQVYSGVNNTSSIVAVTGVAASSPVAPTLPNNALELSRVSVAANATTITNANVIDRRPWLTAAGGCIVCTSTTKPSFVPAGQMIYETDTGNFRIWDGTSIWFSFTRNVLGWQSYTPAWTSSGTAPVLGNGSLTGRYRIGPEADLLIAEVRLVCGSSSSAGTGVWFFSLPFNVNAAGTGYAGGSWHALKPGVQEYGGVIKIESATVFRALISAGGSVGVGVPHAWGTNDTLRAQVIYQPV
jgi:hypothetical protein